MKRLLQGRRDAEVKRLLALSEGTRDRTLFGAEVPFDGWVSFDRHPWKHPWLTVAHLRAARGFSTAIRGAAGRAAPAGRGRRPRLAFVGNIANNLHQRAVALRRAGFDVRVIVHPHDNYVMSSPAWEDSDAVIEDGETDARRLRERGLLPESGRDTLQPPTTAGLDGIGHARMAPFLRPIDVVRWLEFMPYAPVLAVLRKARAVFAVQAPYLAWLARRPYLAGAIGGDLWFDCSRGDKLGLAQRRAYSGAVAVLASNPLNYAHARRYGLTNLVYLPLFLDEQAYSPGEPDFRSEWSQRTGGTFFVLSSARQDEVFKGTSIAVEGFARFARVAPGARLLLTGWGQDSDRTRARFVELGIADRVLTLPLAGKRRLVRYLRSADALLDQFALGYYGASALEGMACGLPVVMRIEAEQYAALCETGAPPVLNTATPDAVARALADLLDDARRRELGEASRRWFLANHSAARWAPELAAMLLSTAAGRTWDFGSSPLSEPLGADERAYHAAGLRDAPVFPAYV